MTPLNIVCKCRCPLLHTSQSTALSKPARKTFLVRAQTNTAQSIHGKNPYIMRVSRMRLFDGWRCACACRARLVGISEGGIIACAASWPRWKKICADCACGRVYGRRKEQNARISATDSRRRGRRSTDADRANALPRPSFASISATRKDRETRFAAFGAQHAAQMRLSPETLSQEFVDDLRIGFAAGRLHHLADKPADRLRI